MQTIFHSKYCIFHSWKTGSWNTYTRYALSRKETSTKIALIRRSKVPNKWVWTQIAQRVTGTLSCLHVVWQPGKMDVSSPSLRRRSLWWGGGGSYFFFVFNNKFQKNILIYSRRQKKTDPKFSSRSFLFFFSFSSQWIIFSFLKWYILFDFSIDLLIEWLRFITIDSTMIIILNIFIDFLIDLLTDWLIEWFMDWLRFIIIDSWRVINFWMSFLLYKSCFSDATDYRWHMHRGLLVISAIDTHPLANTHPHTQIFQSKRISKASCYILKNLQEGSYFQFSFYICNHRNL